jgi:aminoglycoside phosphotransferase (APT) family kinase protein
MPLTREQLEMIIAKALPGEKLREYRELSRNRVALSLASGEKLDLHLFADRTAATTAVTAIRRMRGEVDLPLPLLRASDASGELTGQPCMLTDALAGEPLEQCLLRMNDEQLNAIGRRLGEIAYRIHRLACEYYGTLGTTEAITTERNYGLARLNLGIQQAQALSIVDDQLADDLRVWFDERFLPIGTQAALTCGGLALDTILVRPGRESWSISGMLGWERSLGWAPAWDHTILLDTARSAACFALRVGYGNAYDELTPRTYEQVREGILRPYRILFALDRAIAAHLANETNERERNRRILGALVRLG